MTNQKLASMGKKDILFGAQHAYRNAKGLHDGGILLASEGNYGAANSLLILSAEECIKCMILVAGFTGVKLEFDIEPFFKDHLTKHKEAAKMQKFITNFSFFKRLLIDTFERRKSALNIVNLGVATLFSYFDFGMDDSSRFAKWWGSANKMKNNGFYVGYFDNAWSLPLEITQEIFDETLQMTKPFMEAIEPITKFKEDDYKSFLDVNPRA